MTDEEYDVLMPIGDRFGVRLDNHENVVESMIEAKPDNLSVSEWIEREIPRRFRVAQDPPQWLQEEEWPEGNSGPMIFLGQIEIEPGRGLKVHDTTAFYLFYEETSGATEVVIQQA